MTTTWTKRQKDMYICKDTHSDGQIDESVKCTAE